MQFYTAFQGKLRKMSLSISDGTRASDYWINISPGFNNYYDALQVM